MTSEEEEKPRFVAGGYGRHRRQWVKRDVGCRCHCKLEFVIRLVERTITNEWWRDKILVI